jgi:hypothetical protein
MAIDARSEATNTLLKNNKAIDEQLQTLTGQYLTAAGAAKKYGDDSGDGSKGALTASTSYTNTVLKNLQDQINAQRDLAEEQVAYYETQRLDANTFARQTIKDETALQEELNRINETANTDKIAVIQGLNRNIIAITEKAANDIKNIVGKDEAQKREFIDEFEAFRVKAVKDANLKITQVNSDLLSAQQDFEEERVKFRAEANQKELEDLSAQQIAIRAEFENQLAGLDFVYDEVLGKFADITRDQFRGIDEFVNIELPRLKAALAAQSAIVKTGYFNIAAAQKTANKKRLQESLQAIQSEQLLIDDNYNKQIALTIEKEGIFSKTVNELRDKQLQEFQAFQKRKKELLEQGAATELAIDIETEQKKYEVGLFAVEQASTFTDSLNLLATTRANNEQNRIQEQIDAQVRLAKARGASAEEIQKIQEAGDAQLDAQAKKALEIQKNYAVAQALLDGTSAVLRIFSNAAANPKSILFPAQPYIEAAIAAAFTGAKIAQIKSTSLGGGSAPSGGGGGLFGGPTTGGLSPFGAEFGGTNILPPRLAPPSGGGGRFGETQASEKTGGTQIPIVRAYVLAGDVTDAQTADMKINQKRKL